MEKSNKGLKLAAGLLSLVFLGACASSTNKVIEPEPTQPETSFNLDMDSWYESLNISHDKLIHMLVKEGNAELTRSLFEKGYDPETENRYGETVFLTAANYWYSYDDKTREQFLDIFKQYGVDFTKANNMGTRPLIVALERGFDDLYDHLIKQGDDVSIPSDDANGNKIYPVLRAARNANLEDFKKSITATSDLIIIDHEGRNAADMIISSIASGHVAIQKLEHIVDLGYPLIDHIHSNPNEIVDAFRLAFDQGDRVEEKSNFYISTNENFTKSLSYLVNQGLDLNTLTHSKTKETIAHKAAAYDNMGLLKLLETHNYSGWKNETIQGATARDYAILYRAKDAESSLINKGVHSTLEMITHADLGQELESLIDKLAKPYVSAPAPLSDEEVQNYYKDFPKLSLPPYKTGREPIVVVTGVTNQKALSIEHLNDTVTVIEGTTRKLSAEDTDTSVVGFKANPTNREDMYLIISRRNTPTLLMLGLYEHEYEDIVGSHSVNYSFEYFTQESLKKLYANYLISKPSYKDDYFLRLNPIIHFSNGNNGTQSCALLEDDHKKETCFRGPRIIRFSSRSVNVGAAEKRDDGDWAVHRYSDSHPTYCSPLPLEEKDKIFLGTSFSAPSSAAIEAELTRLHGRSDSFDAGVSHEDIMFALMLTADRNIIDNRTKDFVPFSENSSGIGLSDRCGAGVINAQKANRFLTEVVKATIDGKAKPTDVSNHEVSVETSSPSITSARIISNTEDEYVYEITVPETGYVTKPYALLNFEREQKGAAAFISPRGTKSILRLSLAGHVDTDQFWGEKWEKGEKLLLITSEPLNKDENTRAILRITPEDSALGYAVENRNKILDKTQDLSSDSANDNALTPVPVPKIG